MASNETLSKLSAIVGLDTLNNKGELFGAVLDKLGGGVGAVLLERIQISEVDVFVQKCILVISTLFGGSADQAALRNVFIVNLDSLVEIAHLS